MTLSVRQRHREDVEEAVGVAKDIALQHFTPWSRILIEAVYRVPKGKPIRTALDVLVVSSRRGVYKAEMRGLTLTERIAIRLVARFLEIYHQKYREHFARIVARRQSGRE